MYCYFKNILITIVIFELVVLCQGQPGCSFSLKTDFADKEPVLLKLSKPDNELLIPDDTGVNLKPRDEILISCPGGTNKIVGLNKDVATAKCVQGKTVSIEGKQLQFNTISCEKRTSGEYKDTTEVCGKRGVKKYLGHTVANKFYKLIEICYDQKKAETIYTKHVLQGSAVDNDGLGKTDANFKIGGLEFRTKPDRFYTQANQKTVFVKLLESPQAADQFINSQSNLVRLQLSPKSDFIFTSSANVPFFYINTVPQWQIINNGNWKTLEDAIRKTATNLKEEFKIITGVYDVLTVKNKNNNDVKLYLDEMNTMPVPKYIWKIMYSLKTKKAIAFVNLNNPFLKTLGLSDNVCNDICDKYGWKNTMWKDLTKGAIFCCDVKQLIEKVKLVPSFGEISGVLDAKFAADNKPVPAPKRPTGGCTLNYKTDFPEKEPVLLKKVGENYEQLTPENDALYLNPQQEISLFCSGSGNKIGKLNKNFVTATCASDKNLKIDGKNYNIKDLSCNQRANGEYKIVNTECAGQGLLKKLGHKVSDKSFVSLIDVCYDHKQGEPLYTEHILHGSAIANAKEEKPTYDYKVAGLDFRPAVEEDFKIANQKVLFEKLLQSKDLAQKYINTNSYLARAHLSPAADFLYGSSKYTSYFYINAVPQWQTINNGNWKSLETAIRASAVALKKPLQIITGTYGTLQMKNVKGVNVDIYLDAVKTVPVPKFIWKIVYDPETKKGIAFVVLNNPFVDTITKEDQLCPNICPSHRWGTPDWDKKEKGLLYCCEVSQLMRVIDTIPLIGQVADIQGAVK